MPSVMILDGFNPLMMGEMLVNQTPNLKGQRILLRRPMISDIDDRIKLGKPAEFVRMCGGDTRKLTPYTREQAEIWYRKMLSNPLEWVIEYDSKCIGVARLILNNEDMRGRYSIGIFDTTKLNMGIGTEATQLVLGYAFNILKLHRVDLRVLEYNKRAIACYEKCGFIREGVEREGARIEDSWESDVIMSIFAHEYIKT